jgi:hypothetical protein
MAARTEEVAHNDMTISGVAMIAAGTDFDRAPWTRPEDHVHPSTDLADPTIEGFDRNLSSVEAARALGQAASRLTARHPGPKKRNLASPFVRRSL